jgi:hypothetical protein
VVPGATSSGDGRIPARRRPGLDGKGWWSGVGSPRVPFEAVRRSEDAPAMENGGAADLRPPQPLLQHACSQWRWAGGRGGWSGVMGRLRCGPGTVVASGGWSSSVAHQWRIVGACVTRSGALFVVPRMRRGARRCVDQDDVQLSHGNNWRVQALLQRRHGCRRPVRVTAHGAGPSASLPWARHIGIWAFGAPNDASGPTWISRGVRTPEVWGGDAWCARPRRPRRESAGASATFLFLFDSRLFNMFKLEIFEYKFKIYKNESCRATIGLQPLQKVTYVLLIHLTGKTWRSCRFSTTRNTRTSTQFLEHLHLKFECPPIMKIVSPETTKNFCIGRFWNSIVKFGERARNPNQPFWIYRGLTKNYDFDQGLLCEYVSNHVKHL